MTIFFDDSSTVREENFDKYIISISVCPYLKKILYVSTEKLYICKNSFDNNLISTFTFDEGKIDDYGFFKKCVWLDVSNFVILTISGFLVFFKFDEKTKTIVFDHAIEPNKDYIYTCIHSFNNFIVAGTDNGCFVMVTPFNQNNRVYRLIDFTIKDIRLNSKHCIFLSADNVAYSFKINSNILNQSDANIKLIKIPVESATAIDISQRTNFACVYDHGGSIFVTNFKDIGFKIKTSKSYADCIIFSSDGENIFTFTKDNFIVICSLYDRIARRIKIVGLDGIRTAYLSRYFLIVSNIKGISKVPIFISDSHGIPFINSNLCVKLYNNSSFEKFSMPDEISKVIKTIDFVCFCQNTAVVASKNDVAICKLAGNEWVRPKRTTSLKIRDVSIFDDILVMIIYKEKQFKFFLYFFDFNLNLINEFELHSKPVSIKCDNKWCVLSFFDSVHVYTKNEQILKYNISSVKDVFPLSNLNQLIFHFTNRQLHVLNVYEDQNLSKIEEDISHVFIDYKFHVIIVRKDLRLRIGSTKTFSDKKKALFIPITETADVPIGINEKESHIVCLNSRNSISLCGYYEFAIVTEMQDPDKAATTVKEEKFDQNLHVIIRNIAVYSLREKLGNKLVIFLNHFPKVFNECLATALRGVESHERICLFEALGGCSDIFMKFAGLKQVHNEVIFSFQPEVSVSESDMRCAAMLLPVLMEEQGPLYGFPASIFILRQFYYDRDYVDSLNRYLDPIIHGGKPIDDVYVDCIGMKLKKIEFQMIYNLLFQAYEECLIKLIKKIDIELLDYFSRTTKMNIISTLQKNIKVDEEANIDQLLDELTPITSNNPESKLDCFAILNYLLTAKWMAYSSVFYIIGDNIPQGMNIIQNDQRLKNQLMNSQWRYLLD